MKKIFYILLINSPNLDTLGTRKPLVYGIFTLQNIVKQTKQKTKQSKIKLSHLRSNIEHELIQKIYQSKCKVDFIVINPTFLTHTSIVLRETILSDIITYYEIHLINIYASESFKHQSYLSDIVTGIICGFCADSYVFALESAMKFLSSMKELIKSYEARTNTCKELSIRN